MDPWDKLVGDDSHSPPKNPHPAAKKAAYAKHEVLHFAPALAQENDIDDLLKDIINDKEVGKFVPAAKASAPSIAKKKSEKVYSHSSQLLS